MIGMTSNIKETQRDINKLEKSLPLDVEAVVRMTANKAKELAERYCPQDSGELHDSIYINIEKDNFELGATAKHAVFNEYGCYNIKSGNPDSPIAGKYSGQRPFIRPAIIAAMSYFPEYWDKRWSRTLHG